MKLQTKPKAWIFLFRFSGLPFFFGERGKGGGGVMEDNEIDRVLTFTIYICINVGEHI